MLGFQCRVFGSSGLNVSKTFPLILKIHKRLFRVISVAPLCDEGLQDQKRGIINANCADQSL